MSESLFGIDLGGTKIEGVVIQSSPSLKIIERLRVPTEAEKGYDHILGQIKLLIDTLSDQTKVKPKKLGIGTPGIIDTDTQLIKNSNTLGLMDRPMKKDLEQMFGIPIRMANDANCFAIAETLHGSVKDHLQNPEVVFGVIMGTGVGSGIVVNGEVIQGKHGIGGEWGHNVLDESGPACYCGKNGCVEQFLSGPANELYYQNLSGSHLSMSEIYRLYLDQDVKAVETIDRLLYYFGKAMATVINIIDPEAIVLGGGLGNLDILYTEGRKRVEPYVFNYELKTLFLKPALGDSAGVIGAALL